MIIKMQCIIALVFGFMAWHGLDDAIRVAKRDAENAVLISLPIEALIKIEVRSL